jgi:16S rRNA (adenine(1408)-N(1))-methyltransferase
MAEASRRAAAPTRRGGVPNAIFVAASAEDLPGPLAGAADEITICLPWGSLLRGLLTADERLIDRLIRTLRGNGEVTILISTTDRDAVADGYLLESEGDAVPLADRLKSAGLQVVECRPAGRSDVDRLSSGWGRRLGIPERRRAWLFVVRQDLAASRPPVP